jgi:glycosyltransferase involved in cell wall biosynthesis
MASSRAHTFARHARAAVAGQHPDTRWVRAEANPEGPDPLDNASLFAVLGTYNEEDVIEATVASAFAQGVERVYLVDNASTDDTVARAVRAGAELAEVFRTTRIQESVRVLIMNWVVWRVSSQEPRDHVWWLWLDADEFPQGPDQLTIKQYLDGLDRRFRVAGANYYQHFPHEKPEYISGFHPLEFQPLCEPYWQPPFPKCGIGHYKHPLQRFDRDAPFIEASVGFHTCLANDRVPLVEPIGGIVTHHFQYRDESVTRRRLAEVFGAASGRAEQSLRRNWPNGRRRFETVDAVYEQRWKDVDNQRRIRGNTGVELRPWSEFTSQPAPRRWYSEQDLDDARESLRR